MKRRNRLLDARRADFRGCGLPYRNFGDHYKFRLRNGAKLSRARYSVASDISIRCAAIASPFRATKLRAYSTQRRGRESKALRSMKFDQETVDVSSDYNKAICEVHS